MEENTKTVLGLLRENGRAGRLPMHMPGHKRNPAAAPHLTALSLFEDITEIDGFDNLHGAESMLARSMEKAAALWGAERSFWLVNGSSGGLIAAIRAVTRRGDTVLLTRAAHKSVYHALELCGLRPVFLMPPFAEECGFFGSVAPAAVADALCAHPEARLVILTSPTYEGVLSDVAAIAEIAHAAGVPLLVDEAHGAHLSLSPAFPGGSVAAGADIVVQSLHKTLPSLTQTAVLHVRGDRVDRDRLAHQLAVFQTSSPSYLFLASMDGCVRQMRENPEILAGWAAALARFDEAIAGLAHLSIPYHDGRPLPQAVFSYDPSKIFIRTRGTSLSGADLAAAFRKRGIEPEMVTAEGVLCMTGAGDTEASLLTLARAVRAIDAECTAADADSAPSVPAIPPPHLLPEAALESPWETVSVRDAVGRTAAEYVWAYPPGIPLLIPGEEITPELVSFVMAGETEFYSTRGSFPAGIAVIR